MEEGNGHGGVEGKEAPGLHVLIGTGTCFTAGLSFQGCRLRHGSARYINFTNAYHKVLGLQVR